MPRLSLAVSSSEDGDGVGTASAQSTPSLSLFRLLRLGVIGVAVGGVDADAVAKELVREVTRELIERILEMDLAERQEIAAATPEPGFPYEFALPNILPPNPVKTKGELN